MLHYLTKHCTKMHLIANRRRTPQRRKSPLAAMRVVKLIAIIVLGTCLQASAGVFSPNITFSGRNVSLEKVFSAIFKQSGYLVFCDYSLIREAKKVNINVKDASVQAVMDACLKDQSLSYEIVEKTIVIERRKGS